MGKNQTTSWPENFSQLFFQSHSDRSWAGSGVRISRPSASQASESSRQNVGRDLQVQRGRAKVQGGHRGCRQICYICSHWCKPIQLLGWWRTRNQLWFKRWRSPLKTFGRRKASRRPSRISWGTRPWACRSKWGFHVIMTASTVASLYVFCWLSHLKMSFYYPTIPIIRTRG